jgi:hypothetical protein
VGGRSVVEDADPLSLEVRPVPGHHRGIQVGGDPRDEGVTDGALAADPVSLSSDESLGQFLQAAVRSGRAADR